MHTLKCDRSFIDRLDQRDGASATVVRAVVSLAAGLGLRVVAEGIETPEQLLVVTELGCDLGQGYFLGRPAPRRSISLATPHGVDLTAVSALAELSAVG